jgi:hypothetical protein
VALPEGSLVLATVAYETGTSFVTVDDPAVLFGRGAQCEVRFGHQPFADQGIPRIAGRILAIGTSRIAVENLSDQLGFDIKSGDGLLNAVRPGSIYSPPGREFDILFAGSATTHVLRIEAMNEPVPVVRRELDSSADPITVVRPQLSERQWQVLEMYTEPLRAGGSVSATHREVANRLGWSMSTVRLECSAIWGKLITAGVPMRDFPDKRDAIVDCATRHCLDKPGLPPSPAKGGRL